MSVTLRWRRYELVFVAMRRIAGMDRLSFYRWDGETTHSITVGVLWFGLGLEWRDERSGAAPSI